MKSMYSNVAVGQGEIVTDWYRNTFTADFNNLMLPVPGFATQYCIVLTIVGADRSASNLAIGQSNQRLGQSKTRTIFSYTCSMSYFIPNTANMYMLQRFNQAEVITMCPLDSITYHNKCKTWGPDLLWAKRRFVISAILQNINKMTINSYFLVW